MVPAFYRGQNVRDTYTAAHSQKVFDKRRICLPLRLGRVHSPRLRGLPRTWDSRRIYHWKDKRNHEDTWWFFLAQIRQFEYSYSHHPFSYRCRH